MPPICHFTDVDNLPRILASGCLSCHRTAPTLVDVGNQSIKTMRQTRAVPCDPRGMVCDYVPFYFAPRSPMMYSIANGGVEGVRSDTSRLVYFVSSTEDAYTAGLECVFTDGNASMAITAFKRDPAELVAHIDWPIMKERYWANTTEDGDRVRRRMAEFLIYRSVPLRIISMLGVKDAPAEHAVRTLMDSAGFDVKLRRLPAWYF